MLTIKQEIWKEILITSSNSDEEFFDQNFVSLINLKNGICKNNFFKIIKEIIENFQNEGIFEKTNDYEKEFNNIEVFVKLLKEIFLFEFNFDINFFLDYFFDENFSFKKNMENFYLFFVFVYAMEIERLKEFLFLFKEQIFEIFLDDNKKFNTPKFYRFLIVYNIFDYQTDLDLVDRNKYLEPLNFEEFQKLFFLSLKNEKNKKEDQACKIF